MALEHFKWATVTEKLNLFNVFNVFNVIHANANLNSHLWLMTPILVNTFLKGHSMCFFQRIHNIWLYWYLRLFHCFFVSLNLGIQVVFTFCYYNKYNLMYNYIYTATKLVAFFFIWFICLVKPSANKIITGSVLTKIFFKIPLSLLLSPFILPLYAFGSKNSFKNPGLPFLQHLLGPHSHPFSLFPHQSPFML